MKIAVDYVELRSQRLSAQLALDTMRGRTGWYDPEALQQFMQLESTAAKRQEIREVALRSVSVGMIFAEDVRSTTGVLLVARGHEVTPSFMARMRNLKNGSVAEPLRVIVVADDVG